MNLHQMTWLTITSIVGVISFAVIEHIPDYAWIIPGPRAFAVSLFVNGLLYVAFNLGRGTL